MKWKMTWTKVRESISVLSVIESQRCCPAADVVSHSLPPVSSVGGGGGGLFGGGGLGSLGLGGTPRSSATANPFDSGIYLHTYLHLIVCVCVCVLSCIL